MNCNNQKYHAGFVAIVSLLMVAVIGLTVGITVSIMGIEEIQLSYTRSQSAQAAAWANSCAEEGLEQLRKSWSDFSKTLSGAQGYCIITSQVFGQTATIQAIGTVKNYHQRIDIQADNELNIIYWKEE